MKEFTYTIKDELGLHARPTGLLVKCAKSCSSMITVSEGDRTVDATKLIALMGMAVKQGQTVKVTIEGDNEEADGVTMEKFFSENL